MQLISRTDTCRDNAAHLPVTVRYSVYGPRPANPSLGPKDDPYSKPMCQMLQRVLYPKCVMFGIEKESTCHDAKWYLILSVALAQALSMFKWVYDHRCV